MELGEYYRRLMRDPEIADIRAKMQRELDVGRAVIALRMERGWSQRALARRWGTSVLVVNRIESACYRRAWRKRFGR